MCVRARSGGLMSMSIRFCIEWRFKFRGGFGGAKSRLFRGMLVGVYDRREIIFRIYCVFSGNSKWHENSVRIFQNIRDSGMQL